MNATDPVTLEQNARASELRRKALRDLQSPKSPALSFTYLGLVLLGGFWGWSHLSTKITESLPLLGMAAGAAFFLAAAAFRECVIMRRRLEAATALLLQSNAL